MLRQSHVFHVCQHLVGNALFWSCLTLLARVYCTAQVFPQCAMCGSYLHMFKLVYISSLPECCHKKHICVVGKVLGEGH